MIRQEFQTLQMGDTTRIARILDEYSRVSFVVRRGAIDILASCGQMTLSVDDAVAAAVSEQLSTPANGT
jgi:hypothetical protein